MEKPSSELWVRPPVHVLAFEDDAEILLKKADAAMYQAKQKGRNRIQFWDESISMY